MIGDHNDDINDKNDDKDHVEKTEHCVCKRSQVEDGELANLSERDIISRM